MQSSSSAFTTAIASNTIEPRARAIIQTATGTIYNVENENIVRGSMNVKSRCFTRAFALGSCIIDELKISILNHNAEWNNIDLTGATIWPFSGLLLPGGSIEYIPMGTFIIDEPNRPYDIISPTAHSRLMLLEKPLSDVTVTFPVTAYNLLLAICSECNIPVSPSVASALNMGYVIDNRPTDDISCRDVVSMIGFLAAGFVKSSRDGYLEIQSFPQLRTTPYAGDIFVMGVGSRLDFKQETAPITITGLQYGVGRDVLQFGTIDYMIVQEKIPIIQANETTVLQSIFDEIDGFTYTGFTADYIANPKLDVGDVVKHITRDGQEILTLITTHNFRHASKSTIEAEAQSKASLSFRSADAKRLSTISTKVIDIDEDLTNYESMSAQISDLMTAGLGLYKAELVQPDNSVIVIYHNKPLLEDSDIQWKMSAGAFAVSHDYGATWVAGITADGEMLVTVLTAIGIKADWIKVGGSGADGTIEIKDASDHVIATLGTDGVKLFDASGNQIGGNALIGALQSFVSSALTDDPTNPAFWARIGQLVQGLYTYRGIFGYNRDFSSSNPSFALTSGSNGSTKLQINKGKQLSISDFFTDGSGYFSMDCLKHPTADIGVVNIVTQGLAKSAGFSLNHDNAMGAFAELSIFQDGLNRLGLDAGGVYAERKETGLKRYLNGPAATLYGADLDGLIGVGHSSSLSFFFNCTNFPPGIPYGFLEVLFFDGTGFAPRDQGGQAVSMQRVTSYDGSLIATRCHHADWGSYWDPWTFSGKGYDILCVTSSATYQMFGPFDLRKYNQILVTVGVAGTNRVLASTVIPARFFMDNNTADASSADATHGGDPANFHTRAFYEGGDIMLHGSGNASSVSAVMGIV